MTKKLYERLEHEFEDEDNLIPAILQAFALNKNSKDYAVQEKLGKVALAISVCTFLRILFRLKGFDEDLLIVLRGQLAHFVNNADEGHIDELISLNKLLFSTNMEDSLEGLRQLFGADTTSNGLDLALEKLESWEEEMQMMYFLHLESANDPDLPI